MTTRWVCIYANKLVQNGQDILDNLGELKKTLVERYDDWQRRHPNGASPPTASGSVPGPVDNRAPRAYTTAVPAPVRVQDGAALRDQDRRAADEAREWKNQRQQAEMRDLEQRMRETKISEARAMEQRRAEQDAIVRRQQAADEQVRAIRTNMRNTTPVTPYGPGTPAHSPHNTQPPYSFANGPPTMPLEPPRRHDNASTDSSVILTPRAPVYP